MCNKNKSVDFSSSKKLDMFMKIDVARHTWRLHSSLVIFGFDKYLRLKGGKENWIIWMFFLFISLIVKSFPSVPYLKEG